MSVDAFEADLIVVGLGAMGAAVTFHAARRGMKVIGIDRFDPPHRLGSTHAETRVTRLAVGEGPQYLPFVARSHELWRDLEKLSGEPLLYQCGGLIVTEPVSRGTRWNDFVEVTDQIARDAGIDFARPTSDEIRAAHPTLRIPEENSVGFEPTAGVVMNERAVVIQIDQARKHGATIRTNERVLQIHPDPSSVRVDTDAGSYRAHQIVLAAGPWMPELASTAHAKALSVTRQVVCWFEADDLDTFSVDRHPFVMWVGTTDEDYFAVFPVPPGGTPAVKVLGEQFLTTTTPETVDRTVSDAEAQAFHERFIEPHVLGIRPRCVRAEVCLYTNTADDHFLIDTDPRSDHILVMSPCSGHGFKHSAALGEAVAERVATGASTLDLTPFAAR